MGGYLGLIMYVMAVIMLVPLIMIAFVPSEARYAPTFVLTAALLGAIGFLLRFAFKLKEQAALDFNESSVVVFLTWAILSLAGTIPYMAISGMTFTQAVFDSISGWTTTGLSLLDIPKAPAIILFYRAWAQFVGGAGIAIIMLASLTGVGSQQIYSAEGKGTLIKPNVLASTRIVLKLYMGYFVLGTVAYLICGMRMFDAVVHCFAAISTGGFSNYVQSMGYFNSPAIEFISIVLMILGNLSFLMGYYIVKGKFRHMWRNGEVRVLTLSLLVSIPVLFLAVTSRIYSSASFAFRDACFEAVSALTTTGFSLVNYTQPMWYDSGVFILTLLMLVGGGTCSTAGGIKQYRIYMLYKSVLWHIKASLMPNHTVSKKYVWEGDLKSYPDASSFRRIANFVFLYLSIYVTGVIILALSTNPATGTPYSLRDAMFEFASSLGTVGLTIGVSSTSAPQHVIWVESIGMLLGRLEIYVVFLALIKLFRDSVGHISIRRNAQRAA